MTTTIDGVLTLLSTLAPLVPIPAVGVVVPLLVTLARELAANGAFDVTAPIEIDHIGDAHRAALTELLAALDAKPR
mgnify:CR=1 FL=1